MTGTSVISGLVSGLDTANIISSLMQIEALPQSRLKTAQTTEKSVVTALQALNTSFASLGTAAEKLAKASTWQTIKGTSSSTGFTVTTGTAATATSLKVTVASVASKSQLVFATPSALTGSVTSQDLTLTTNDGTQHTVETGTGTLSDVIKGINALSDDTGVSATAVKVADGSYRLLVQSATTGADTTFTLTNADGSDLLGGATSTAGTDASISLGNGLTATSTTNTFTDLLPGVSLELSSTVEVGATTTITLAQDSTEITAAVKALVDQVNSILSTIDAKTKYSSSSSSSSGSATSANGVLAGDATVNDLRYELFSAVFGGDESMAAAGLQTDRYGMLVFDEDTFTEAYAADPDGVAAMFTSSSSGTDGWAARVHAVVEGATDAYEGTLSAAITRHTNNADDLQDRIDAWDLRLQLREDTLTAKFTAMETVLSTLNSQSEWLSQQIESLSSSDS